MKVKPISAVIFDMDGLMFDSERVGRAAWRQAGEEFGYNIGDEHYQQVSGRTVADATEVFRGIFGEDFPFQEIRRRRVQIARDYFEQHGVPIKPGLLELLDYLDARALPRAVATSTDYAPAMEKLTRTALAKRMHAIVTGDRVARGKPAPDIFFAAAKQLNADPPRCLVLEDSEAGIRAAHSAGMIPVMVPDLKQPSEEVRRLAVLVAASLDEVREWMEGLQIED